MNNTEFPLNFPLSEFLHSETAIKKGIDNTPRSSCIIPNLKLLADSLQKIRDALGSSVVIISGYRTPELNKAVGGSIRSSHMSGLAADIYAPKISNLELCKLIINLGIPFDQLILYTGRKNMVHFGIGGKMRGEVMTNHSGKLTHGIS